MWSLSDFKIEDQRLINTEKSKDKKVVYETKVVITLMCNNVKGDSCCFRISDYKPYFYVLINELLIDDVIESIFKSTEIKKKYFRVELSRHHKLGNFDNKQEYNFAKITCDTLSYYSKISGLWYYKPENSSFKKLKKDGFVINNVVTTIYEADMLPLFNFLHERDIDPSGWFRVENETQMLNSYECKSMCVEEYEVSYMDVYPVKNVSQAPNYKICSFDIEASSSHGDFPIPIKTYFKLASQLIEHCIRVETTQDDIIERIHSAFAKDDKYIDISPVYTKNTFDNLNFIEEWANDDTFEIKKEIIENENENEPKDEDDEDEPQRQLTEWFVLNNDNIKIDTPLQCLVNLSKMNNKKEIKLTDIIVSITKSMDKHFPNLEGDKVTYIGSTFMNYITKEKKSICLVLGQCDPIDNIEIISCETEKLLLLAWTNLINTEDPDIIIGYNIDGFDFKFMSDRAKELDCFTDFLDMSRIKKEKCYDDKTKTLFKNKIKVASGEYTSYSIQMTGRVNIDLLKYFRRNENFASYKLDDVSGYYLKSYIEQFINPSTFKSKNTN
jgi:DNA polymerase elongation subunit (family B)